MASTDWRNNEPRIRMRTDPTPPPEVKPKVMENEPINRGEVALLGLIVSAVVGLFCYTAGEWRGSANVASVMQPITLETLREKYGNQDWVMQFDSKKVISVWDEQHKVMTYLHLADDDYAVLLDERDNWPRPNPFSALVGAALSTRCNVETEVPLPENRPALTLKEFESQYGCWMMESFFDEDNVITVNQWTWNTSRKGCDFVCTNPRLVPEDYKALKAEAMRGERVYSVEDACARVLAKRFPRTDPPPK